MKRLSIAEAASLAGMSRQRLGRLVSSGRIAWRGADRRRGASVRGVDPADVRRYMRKPRERQGLAVRLRRLTLAGVDARQVFRKVLAATVGGVSIDDVGAVVRVVVSGVLTDSGRRFLAAIAGGTAYVGGSVLSGVADEIGRHAEGVTLPSEIGRLGAEALVRASFVLAMARVGLAALGPQPFRPRRKLDAEIDWAISQAPVGEHGVAADILCRRTGLTADRALYLVKRRDGADNRRSASVRAVLLGMSYESIEAGEDSLASGRVRKNKARAPGLAQQVGVRMDVARAARAFGISRPTAYAWRKDKAALVAARACKALIVPSKEAVAAAMQALKDGLARVALRARP